MCLLRPSLSCFGDCSSLPFFPSLDLERESSEYDDFEWEEYERDLEDDRSRLFLSCLSSLRSLSRSSLLGMALPNSSLPPLCLSLLLFLEFFL
jgi:hypothetical protein